MLASQKRTTLTFSIIVAIFISIIITLIIFLLNFFPYLKRIFSSLVNKAETVCDCLHHIPFLNGHPYITALILGVSALAVIFFLYFIFHLVKNILATRKFIKLTLREKSKLQAKLIKAAAALGLSNKVVSINSTTPQVFCFGFFRPKICVSQILVNQVSRNQLKAILLHEKNHLTAYDPLKLFLASTIRKSLFFVPGLKKLVSEFVLALELEADERATNNFRDTMSLSKALLKIIALHQTVHRPAENVAVTLLNVTEARIDRLINNHNTPTFKWFIPKLMVSLVVIIGLSVLLLNSPALLAKTTSYSENENEISYLACPMIVEEYSPNYYCSLEKKEVHPTCTPSYESSIC